MIHSQVTGMMNVPTTKIWIPSRINDKYAGMIPTRNLFVDDDYFCTSMTK